MLFGHVAPFYNIPIIFHDRLALGSKRMKKLTDSDLRLALEGSDPSTFRCECHPAAYC